MVNVKMRNPGPPLPQFPLKFGPAVALKVLKVVRGDIHGRASSFIALTDSGQYIDHMQAVFPLPVYDPGMAKTASSLRALREAAGLSVREVARQIGEQHTNVLYWETSGNLPRSNILLPLARVLGVTVEELLGQSKPRRAQPAGGKLGQVFEKAARLPRRQQQKIIELLEPFVERHTPGPSNGT
jgi:transcriptional regulator with XRE-family HTH domain